MNGLMLRQLFDRETCTYTYLVMDTVTSEGILIDPVKEQVARDFQLIQRLGIQLKYILDTHVHADHITGAGELRQLTGAKTVLGVGAGVACADLLLKHQDTIPLGAHTLQVFSTPGHTNSCSSYYIEGMVFTGDALLIGGCGRTDFQQGSPHTLYHSVTQHLFTLPEETAVYPGHDYQGFTTSTIGEQNGGIHD